MNDTPVRKNLITGSIPWLREIFSRVRWLDGIFVLFLLVYSFYYLGGISSVPFHPDEATQMYMSADLRTFFIHPASLMWQASNASDPRMLYRELDAPLARYLDGIGLAVTGFHPLESDWDWSKTWIQNQQAGALPDAKALQAARIPNAVLFIVSLILLYLAGRRFSHPLVGMAAVVILALDSVVILHTRRAMAEGTLLFTVILFIYLALTTDNPWLLGISAGLAFCAKQSSLPLVGVGLLAILWSTQGPKKSPQNLFLRGGIYAVSCLGLILLLNPFLWAHPIDAVGSALWARQDLISRQNADTQRLAPGTLLDSPVNKSIAMVAQVYYLPTTYEEIGNYRNEITAQANLYMQSPFVNWLRGPMSGSVLLFLTLWGIITSLTSLRRSPLSRRNIVLLLLLTLTQAAALLVSLSLSWQRYYIPMFPYMAFWSAVGMYELLLFFQKLSTLRLPRV